jgi:muramoyltetrapeptide carboxypeptidase
MLPPFLTRGDLVALVATARKITLEELEGAVKQLEEAGFRVRFGDTIGLVNNQLAGSDAERAADFNKQLADPEVKAILCARGGYGSVRMVDGVDWSLLRVHPKWIIGFSDVTVLHAHAQKNTGIATLHAEMAFNFGKDGKDPRSCTALLQVLQGQKIDYPLVPHRYNRGKSLQGELIGGNLSVLYSLLGSSSMPDFRGKILFLEDLDEYLYHIDRMMMGLKRAGKLEGLAGLIVGGMTDMKDNAIAFGRDAEQIVFDAVDEYGYPLLFGFPAGHTALNMPVIFGEEIELRIPQ